MDKWTKIEDDNMRLMYQCYDCGSIAFEPHRSPTIPFCDSCTWGGLRNHKPMDYIETQYLLPQPLKNNLINP